MDWLFSFQENFGARKALQFLKDSKFCGSITLHFKDGDVKKVEVKDFLNVEDKE